MRLDYKKTFILGFGFMATTIAWAVYNAYVPVLLESYVSSAFLIGIIMTIDNIFGVVFQPLFGALSDKTKARKGTRMPFILIGIPICAVLLVFIPQATSVISLMTVVILFNFVMSTWRAPVVALMPDQTPSEFRSKANGIINLMGGLGTLIIFVGGGILFNIGGMSLPFIFSAIIMIIAVLTLKFFIKEKPHIELQPEIEKEEKVIELTAEEKKLRIKSLLFMLFAILFWFIAYSAVETFFTLYATNVLTDAAGQPMSLGDASIMLGAFSLMYLVFAIPAGFLGTKFGRKKVILIGLIGIIVMFGLMFFVRNITLIYVILVFAGICWSAISINSYPMVVDMGSEKTLGRFTGYYYFFSFLASIISPVLFGAIRDVIGSYEVLFIYSAISFVVAVILMLFVRGGEAKSLQKINNQEAK